MSNRLLVFTACLLGLLSTVGIALPYPILAPLFADVSVSALSLFAGLPPKLLLGVVLAVYPLGMLLGTGLLGTVADRYGRRLVLLWTTFFSAIGHLATFFALIHGSYLLFLLSRFATGFTEGNSAVTRALLADTFDGNWRVKAFAWFNGSVYSGWLLGPLLTGATIPFGIGVPFLCAAAILVFTLLFAIVIFPQQSISQSTYSLWHSVTEEHAFSILKHLPLRRLFVIYSAYTLGITAFYEFFPLWLVEYVKMKVLGISLVSAALCAVMTITSVLLGRGLLAAPRPESMRSYAVLGAVCIALTALCGPVGGCVALILFGIPHAFFNTILPSYCAERFDRYGQGALMGMLETTFCLTNMIVAIVGAGVTLIDTRLMLILGACSMAWAGWQIGSWIISPVSKSPECGREVIV